MADIHATSIIARGAKLARDVVVGPFCTIGPKVRIASGVVVHGNVTIDGATTIGVQCEIFPMAAIGVSADGGGAVGKCVLGRANAVREHVTIYAGDGRETTTLGDDNLVMIGSQIGPGATVGDHNILANVCHVASGATIENYVRMSAFSYVDENVSLGSYTFVAGFAHVDRVAPPFAMLQGSPFRVRGVNSHLLKSCGFGEEDIRELKRLFRELYNGTGTVNAEAMQRICAQRGGSRPIKALKAYFKRLEKAKADDVSA